MRRSDIIALLVLVFVMVGSYNLLLELGQTKTLVYNTINK